MLNSLCKYLLDKLPELITLLLGSTSLAAYLQWEGSLLLKLQQYILPLWQLRLLAMLLSLSVILGALLILKRSKYTEYRGAYFKPKKGGGYHQVVYCGSCKTPTSYEGDIQFLDKKFKCKCGWVSSFNLGEFSVFYPSL